MEFSFRQAQKDEIKTALALLRSAAKTLQFKNIDQWSFWLDPTPEKIKWIEDGFANNEFFFIVSNAQVIGMFRLLDNDLLYWGKRNDSAKYIHSLVIDERFSGNQLGKRVIDKIILDTIHSGVFILRLDCNASNPKLCRYYEKQGFKKVGEVQMPHSLNNLYEMQLTKNLTLQL
jgi:ribosomal protein S18 acetylase RimI-like enzyme